MRKATVKIKPNVLVKLGIKDILNKIQRMELEELLKLDYQKAMKVGIAKITMKKGYELKDLRFPKNAALIDVLSQTDNTYTVIMKSFVPKSMHGLTKKFDMDLIWTKPAYFENNEIVFSCIGPDKDLKKFVRLSKFIGKVISVSYNPADYRGHHIISVLTEKQKEIFRIAKASGYYEYPRKIDGTKLAKVVGISKPTLIEHLRRIENKIMRIVE